MNFRRILSKSSTSSGKSVCHQEDVSKLLYAENESLKQTVESLKLSLENRDAAIGTLAREKESIYLELKSVQRSNRNLHQQLVDERDIHAKEKDYLIEEIKRITKNIETKKQNICLNIGPFSHSLAEELKAKDEVICNVCSKYLKIKDSKIILQKKIEKMQYQCEKACQNIIILLQENRLTLDSILRKFINSTAFPPNSKQYIKLLKVNANLHYENTQLKICLSEREFLKNFVKEKQLMESYSTTNTLVKYSLGSSKLDQGIVNRLKRCKLTKVEETNKIEKCLPCYYKRRVIVRSKSDPCLTKYR